MSGSPKYSTVRVSAQYARREAEERRRRAEERRGRELRRAAERARLAQEAAARRERARAEAERRQAEAARKEAELAARRAAEQDAHVARVRADRARADERGLEEVRELIDRAGRSGALADAGGLETRWAELRNRVARGDTLGNAVEELRGRVVAAAPAAEDRGMDPRGSWPTWSGGSPGPAQTVPPLTRTDTGAAPNCWTSCTRRPPRTGGSASRPCSGRSSTPSPATRRR
ncbi:MULTISPECIES: hypothetical protein [unclassified Streptomyces]|uniref:hypothetical protein n=1 Tax=unclassified Streptomyces TaxID=2593676 RepID=UPI001F546F25|nr:MULTISPECIES: hypothetical protein [unclassified Streptomyces]